MSEYIDKYREVGQENKQEEDPTINKIVDNLLKKYYVKTIYHKGREKTIWLYNKGVYKVNGLGILEKEAEEMLGTESNNHKVNEIIGKIQRQTRIDSDDFFDEPEGLVLLENGVFDLKEMKLKEFTKNHHFIKKIPLTYNEAAVCPEIMKYINETFYEEDIPVIQEWFGFQLYNKYFIKKAMIVYGPKDTGKSVFLNLLTSFIGYENTAGLSLQEISYGKSFNLTDLYKKYCNIHDDLSGKDLKETGKFKMAVGNGWVSAEHKFGDRFKFLNYAKHTFACNKIPLNEEIQDDAYWGRWIPIPLDNQLKGDEIDDFLIQKLTTPQEMQGLLNWALEGLKRLLKNGKFTYNKTEKEIKDIMLRFSTPLVAFIQDCVIKQDGNRMDKDLVYNIYTQYCENNKMPRLSKQSLSIKLKKLIPYLLDFRDSKKRYWKGVTIKYDTYDDFKIFGGEVLEVSNTIHTPTKVKNKVSLMSLPTSQKEILKELDYNQKELTGIDYDEEKIE